MKRKKYILGFLVLILITQTLFLTTVSASEEEEKEKFLQECLQLYDIEITEATKIEIININSTQENKRNLKNDAMAAIITNIKGETVYKDVILKVIDSKSGDQSRAGESGTLNGSLITIRGTAVYDLYSDGNLSRPKYFSPYGCYVIYTKGSASNVTRISADYVCDGIVYSYPGFINQNREDVHTVSVNKTNPVEGTIYTGVNYYDPNYVLFCNSGSISVGNFMTLGYTADGKSDFYTIVLSSNP